MKQRQFQDFQLQNKREENHKLAVDYERSLNQEIIDPRLAKKYLDEKLQEKLFITAIIMGRTLTNSPEQIYKMWKELRKT